MKKHIALLIFSVLLLQLVSCGSSTDDVQTSMELPDAETVERQTEKETDYLDQYTGVDYEGAVYIHSEQQAMHSIPIISGMN